jgi:crotonobetainyl-CoA:carnitine CoA-transferase CaiB-like acyl-CoA transferase
MMKLLSKADVFITNMRPGALQKLGLDWPSLSKFNDSAYLLSNVSVW